MELLAKLTDGTPVKLTLKEYKTSGVFEYYLITKIEPCERAPEIPEWLTLAVQKDAKDIWNRHKTVDDHLRVEAIKYLQKQAHKANYMLGPKLAMELMHEILNK